MSEDDFSVPSDEDEAPSLSDLPLTAAGDDHSTDHRRSISEPADFFEFMMPNLNSSSYTFSWNDLVWPSASPISGDESRRPLNCTKTRRSESFNESKITTQYSSLLKSPCFRPSRSLDYCRLRRNPSSSRSSRTNENDSSERANLINSGPRAPTRSLPWYWLMFGPLRFPPAAEIELRRSGRNRQARAPATLFPVTEKDRRGWKLISVLSCKNDASVAVTTPFQAYCK